MVGENVNSQVHPALCVPRWGLFWQLEGSHLTKTQVLAVKNIITLETSVHENGEEI